MILNLFATTALLSFLSFSSALFLDSSVHVARHQQIAARRSPVKRSSGSARCKARSPPSASVSSSPAAVSVAVKIPQPISPVSSSTPAPSPSPTPSSSSHSSGKVGIAWALGDDPALKNFITPKVSAIYTWSPDKPPNTFGLDFCMMLWGTNQVADFNNLAQSSYANCVYGPNEPNLGSQSNLDPGAAAQLWIDNILPLKQKGYTQFFTPAVTSAPTGKDWLQGFIDACTGCQIDGINLHIYATTSAEMINYIKGMHENFLKYPIQVTEFACQSFTGGEQCSRDQAFAFMSEVTAWMDQTDYITKYFAYGVMRDININPVNRLMADDGTPTALGRLYIGS